MDFDVCLRHTGGSTAVVKKNNICPGEEKTGPVSPKKYLTREQTSAGNKPGRCQTHLSHVVISVFPDTFAFLSLLTQPWR